MQRHVASYGAARGAWSFELLGLHFHSDDGNALAAFGSLVIHLDDRKTGAFEQANQIGGSRDDHAGDAIGNLLRLGTCAVGLVADQELPA